MTRQGPVVPVSPSPGVELVFGIHTCPDRFPCWGISQKFLVVPLTVTDAVSPGRSCTRRLPLPLHGSVARRFLGLRPAFPNTETKSIVFK